MIRMETEILWWWLHPKLDHHIRGSLHWKGVPMSFECIRMSWILYQSFPISGTVLQAFREHYLMQNWSQSKDFLKGDKPIQTNWRVSKTGHPQIVSLTIWSFDESLGFGMVPIPGKRFMHQVWLHLGKRHSLSMLLTQQILWMRTRQNWVCQKPGSSIFAANAVIGPALLLPVMWSLGWTSQSVHSMLGRSRVFWTPLHVQDSKSVASMTSL